MAEMMERREVSVALDLSSRGESPERPAAELGRVVVSILQFQVYMVLFFYITCDENL